MLYRFKLEPLFAENPSLQAVEVRGYYYNYTIIA
jgi:hypothetical protein